MSRSVEARQRIFLVGMMGSGKSTVGRMLANKLNYDLVDIDAVIEQHASTSISEIFVRYGEEAFRRLESAVLADTANRIKLVFATGGGIMQNDDNREIILTSGLVVWLRCSLENLIGRVRQGEGRPMLEGYDLRERMEQLLVERTPDYEQAHLIVDADDRSKSEIVREIADYYQGWLTLEEN